MKMFTTLIATSSRLSSSFKISERMGISVSKRVRNSLSNSPEFDSACDSTFSFCLSQTQHAFQSVFPYQLSAASDHLYRSLALLRPLPLIAKWLPSPPSRTQVDSAFLSLSRSGPAVQTLGRPEFKAWAIELFVDAIVGNVRKKLFYRVPIGIAGIAGVGTVTRSGKEVVGSAIGIYAIGVAASIYLNLSG